MADSLETSREPQQSHPKHINLISADQFPQSTLTRLPSTSDHSVRSSRDLSAPDAAAALASVHPPDIDMEVESTSGHRRRKSSLINNPDAAKGKNKKGPDGILEDPNAEVGDDSTSEDVELDDLSDDGLQDDEETGLTADGKRKRKRRRQENTALDQRIVPDSITKEERKEADKYVVRNSLINVSLIGLWYIFSLSISIYNKWMFDPEHLNFHFPLFTTSLHMVVQFSLASCVLFFFPRFRPRYDSISNPHSTARTTEAELHQHKEDNEKSLMTRWFYFTRIGPCGLATGLDIGLGNMSLKFITLTFYTMCKSSSLIFVLCFAFVFRLESPSVRLILIILTMTFGVLMMVAGEVTFSAIGFILVISAAFFSGFRWGLTQILLLRNPATSNPFSSIFYLAPIMFVSLFIIAIPVEGFPALAAGLEILINQKGPLLGPALLLFPGCIAFLMTASEFALLQRTSVVTLSIAGIFKEVVTISAAGLVFGDSLTPINISGLFVTIGAIAAYNYIKIKKMREQAQEDAHRHHLVGQEAESDIDSDEEEADWNTADTTYVTSDGDIMPNPSALSTPSKMVGGKKARQSGSVNVNPS